MLKAKEGIAVNLFLMYMLNFLDLRPYLVGSTRTKLNQKDMKRIMLPLPPLEEQWGIAEVLSTVDRAIEKTEKLIERLERLKKALMQELLTKGIGHKEYKQTPIGKIPKEWKIVKFKEIMLNSPQSGLYKNKKFYGEGVKIVRMTELFRGNILRIDYDMKRVRVSDNELAKYSLEPGDLLFARRSLKVEGSGKCVLVPQLNEPVIFESSILRVRLNKKLAYPLFYLYYLNSELGRRQIKRMIRTVAVSGITGRDLQKILIPLPPLTEQYKIADILMSIDKWIKLEKKRKEKLERLKKGLMNLLLTGQVRVKVVKEEVSISSSSR